MYIQRQVTNTIQPKKQLSTHLRRPSQRQPSFPIRLPIARRTSSKTDTKYPNIQPTQGDPTRPRQQNRSNRATYARPYSPLQTILSQPLNKLYTLHQGKDTNLHNKDLHLLPLTTLTKKRGTPPNTLHPSNRPTLIQHQLTFRQTPSRHPSPITRPYNPIPIMRNTRINKGGISFWTGHAEGQRGVIVSRPYYREEGTLW